MNATIFQPSLRFQNTTTVDVDFAGAPLSARTRDMERLKTPPLEAAASGSHTRSPPTPEVKRRIVGNSRTGSVLSKTLSLTGDRKKTG